jgi:hypothetical protein
MIKLRALFVLFLVLLIAGCATTVTTPVQRNAVFIESEYEPYKGKGTASIAGQAFAKTRAGDVKYAAGNTIFLNPVTSYSTEFFNILVQQQQIPSPPDPRIYHYNRQTIADGNGNFEFKNLPPGEYYIHTIITWEVPSRYGLQTTGGAIGTRVKVGPGETIKAIVTH